MSNIKFSQLPNLGNITANTIVPVVSANTNFTVTAANLQTYVNTSAGNISGGNLLTGGVASATGNITGGNLLTGGAVTATGNITGNYILGNGSQLTGLPALYGNANVASFLSTAFGSNTISTTGTVTAGNITGGNVLTGGVVSATGNITGNYILGNGSALTGLPAGYSNANVVTLLASFGSNSISTTGNITGGYFAGNGAGLTNLTSNVVSNVISSGNNFANTAAGNGRMWINGGNSVATGNIDGLGANLLFISAGGVGGPRMVMDPSSMGNIAIIPGNSINGILTLSSSGTYLQNGAYYGGIINLAQKISTNQAASTSAGFNQPLNPKTTSSATGTEGDIVWDTNYIYICTAANTWKRAALSSY
jgi:hypothetical protein